MRTSEASSNTCVSASLQIVRVKFAMADGLSPREINVSLTSVRRTSASIYSDSAAVPQGFPRKNYRRAPNTASTFTRTRCAHSGDITSINSNEGCRRHTMEAQQHEISKLVLTNRPGLLVHWPEETCSDNNQKPGFAQGFPRRLPRLSGRIDPPIRLSC